MDRPDTEPGRFAVVGNPIGHSLSPIIHRAFARQFGCGIDYQPHHVELDAFEGWVTQFFSDGGRGLNVTLPFKSRAFMLATESSPRAGEAGAANFLVQTDRGGIAADNTDGIGLVRDMLSNHGWLIEGKRILVLGAGGAVRGIISALVEERPEMIYIANRTEEKAVRIAHRWSHGSVFIEGGGLDNLPEAPWDLIINGTSASLSGKSLQLPENLALTRTCCCYDMMYSDGSTPFMNWASAREVRDIADGLGMLVEQAAESYYLWLGDRPDTKAVLQQLR